MMNRQRHWIGVASLIMACWVWIGAAQAHADLLSSNPDAGAVLTEAPSMIELHFSEPVRNAEISLIHNSVEYTIPVTEYDRNDHVVRGAPPDSLESGVYIVFWRVDSQDTHDINGSYSFEYQRPTNDDAGGPPMGLILGGMVAFSIALSVGGYVYLQSKVASA